MRPLTVCDPVIYPQKINYAPYHDEFDLYPNQQSRLFNIFKYNLYEVESKIGVVFPYLFLLREGAIVAGGAVRDWLVQVNEREDAIAGQLISLLGGDNNAPTDIDVFFLSEEGEKTYIQFLTEQLNASVIRGNHRVTDFLVNGLVVQTIKSLYYQSSAHLISTFDFTDCQFCVARENGRDFFYVGETSLEDLKKRRIIINQINYPMSTMRRLLKYAKKGYFASKWTLMQVAHALVKAPAGLTFYNEDE